MDAPLPQRMPGLGRIRRVGRPFFYEGLLPTAPDFTVTDALDFDLILHGLAAESRESRIKITDLQSSREMSDQLSPILSYAGALRGDSLQNLGYNWFNRPYPLANNSQFKIDTDGADDANHRFLIWIAERDRETREIEIGENPDTYRITTTRQYSGAGLIEGLEIGNYSRDLLIYGAASDMPDDFQVRINDTQRQKAAWSKSTIPVGALAMLSGQQSKDWFYPVCYFLPKRQKLVLDVRSSGELGTFSFTFLCEVLQ